MANFRWRHKCSRCNRPIKTGQEVWLKQLPYGVDCARMIVNMEASYEQKSRRSSQKASGDTKVAT